MIPRLLQLLAWFLGYAKHAKPIFLRPVVDVLSNTINWHCLCAVVTVLTRPHANYLVYFKL